MFYYQYTKHQIASELGTGLDMGLSKKEVGERLLKHGQNVLPDIPPESIFLLFFRQFKSPLIYILVVCAGVVFYLGDYTDSIIIVAVLVFNAIIGSIQEGRSQQTLRSLKKLSSVEASVIRNGEEEVVLESNLVPGDLLVLQEGQKVGADARVVFSSNLSCDEAALTGESGAVVKKEETLDDLALPLSSQHNMVFKGTSVLSGNGRAIVVGTGLSTEIGKISRALLNPQTEIPLQKNIRKLSVLIIYAVGVISAALFFLGLWRGTPAEEMFAVVVSMAVSMIPEGLPLVLTLILVSGVFRMSKKNALVKKMQAVEALGRANVLAVDKTGTVTRNEMVVKKLFLGGKIYQVTGNGYEPRGRVEFGGQAVRNSSDIEKAAMVAALSIRATVSFIEQEGVYKVAGDPTEAALGVFAEKLGSREKLLEQYEETAEIPFNYKTKYRAIFYKHREEVVACIAGAPEALFKKAASVLENGQHKEWDGTRLKIFEEAQEEFSAQGLRVVAFGFKNMGHSRAFEDIGEIIIGGLFAIEDAVRPEARSAVRAAISAGLKVVMITGDHRQTARSIAKEAGIYQEGDRIVTGPELSEMSAKQLAAILDKVSVFARVTPEDKMKIIEAFKHNNLIVAMTGDGVNDAPSLMAADLGVGMGKIGTEVAKEAADIVLLDDNLHSIVAAIEEGRNMYRNIQKALLFLFSTSLGELFALAGALLLGWPLPILAAQILWLNLITDPLIGSALAVSKKEEGLLKEKPSGMPKYFFDTATLIQTFIFGIAMASVSLYLFWVYLPLGYTKAVTVSLTILAVCQWFRALSCTSLTETIFQKRTLANYPIWLAIGGNFILQLLAIYSPGMQKVLKTTGLNLQDWIVVISFASSVIIIDEIRKVVLKILKHNKKTGK